MLIVSLVLHQTKEVSADPTQKEVNSECKTLAYIGIILTIFGFSYGHNPALQKNKTL